MKLEITWEEACEVGIQDEIIVLLGWDTYRVQECPPVNHRFGMTLQQAEALGLIKLGPLLEPHREEL